MSAPLTGGEIVALERTLRTMLSTHDHADPVSWSVALCEAARGLGGGRMQASVYLPGGARPALVHTSLDPAVTRDYFAHFWREDAPMLELVRRRLPVAHALMVCDERDYYGSTLYHEYVRPNRIDLSVGLSAYRPAGDGVRLMLTYERRPADAEVERVTSLLGILVPAFAAATAAWQSGDAGPRGGAPAGPALVCDVDGRVLHETPALAALLRGDPGAASVRDAARAVAGAGAVLLRRAGGSGAALAALAGARRTVRTPGGAYRLHCTLAGEGLGSGRAALVVDVEALGAGAPAIPATPATPTAAVGWGVAERFGLTAQECAVAELMGARRTDAEIGAALGISPNTARTHAERVRRKLGVSRRTQVAELLARVGAAGA
jgi:DNA-binding CsgD family transcriptional regulator